MLRRAFVIAVAFSAVACETVPEGAPSEAAVADQAPDPAQWVASASAALRDDFDAAYAEWLGSLVASEPLRNVLLGDPIPSLRRQQFMAHLYDARGFAPVLVEDGRPGERARAVVDFLATVGSHGLNPADYVKPVLLAVMDTQQQLAHALDAAPRVSATTAERRTLASLVEQIGEPEGAVEAVLRHALDVADPESSPVPELAAAHRQNVALRRATEGNAALLDALLVDAVLAYAFDQRNFNTSWVDHDLDDAGRNQVIAERTEQTFEALAATTDTASLAAFFEALQPHNPQYAGLVAERARYAEIVAAGGWEEVTPRSMRRGSSGSVVSALQRRLAAEGYYEGEIHGRFDEAVENAVRAYQETHQMEVTGESSAGFWSSINIPADQRLAQIDLTLQRWRESRIGDDPYYIFVNVPDFHAEVWRDGVREMRFRIVTGNTEQVCDPRTGRIAYANATPLQTASMSYVVLNPTWNVPRRIAEEELLPELLANPNYFEDKGFERYTTPDGIEIIRQLPGPDNPLGVVKFMFPNPHNTYMHDTSRPQYFRYPVRAFSHGCMRVQDPLDLLERVLTNDGQWDEARIRRIFDSKQETSITLRNAVPVHIEYYVVRVDDEGRANFLADIYRLDRDRLDPPSSDSLRCTAPTGEPRLVLGEGNTVLFEDQDGNRYTQAQWDYVRAGGVLARRPDGSFADPPAPPPPGTPGEGTPVVDDALTEGDYGP